MTFDASVTRLSQRHRRVRPYAAGRSVQLLNPRFSQQEKVAFEQEVRELADMFVKAFKVHKELKVRAAGLERICVTVRKVAGRGL